MSTDLKKPSARNVRRLAKKHGKEQPEQNEPAYFEDGLIPSTSEIHSDSHAPVRYTSERKIDWSKWIIPASALATGTLVGLAAPQLIDASSTLGIFKAVLLGTAAAFISWTVNHHAVKYGTELTARGLKMAGVASLMAVGITGTAAFAFSYSGITLNQVDALNYDEHGQALADYIEQTNDYSVQITQIQPTISAFARDIEAKLECEVTEGCLSGGGGKGLVYRSLLQPTQRARNITHELEASDNIRNDQLALSKKLLADYRQVQSNAGEFSSEEYREKLSTLDAEIKQQVASLREAVPMSLIRAYQLELDSGLSITGHPEGTRIVNSILDQQAKSIGVAMKDIQEAVPASPAFPAKAGVSDAFERFAHFWPIGVLTAAIELIIPITLWLLTYAAIVLRLYRQDQVAQASQDGERV
jgi:uncharacterized membrane protein YeaQ/YmgE (transglycosylase-associated protein family)